MITFGENARQRPHVHMTRARQACRKTRDDCKLRACKCAARLQEHLHRMMRGRMLVNTFEHERYHDNVRREREAAPTCAHDASSPSVQQDRHGHGIGDWRDVVARSEYRRRARGSCAQCVVHEQYNVRRDCVGSETSRAQRVSATQHAWYGASWHVIAHGRADRY